MSGAIVRIEHCHAFVQLVLVCLHVAIRSEQPLLFSSPQGESNTPPRRLTESHERARHFEHAGSACAVILRARREVPRIEMCANKNPLVRSLASANLRDYVVDLGLS